MKNIIFQIAYNAKLIDRSCESLFANGQNQDAMQWLIQRRLCDETDLAQSIANYYDFTFETIHVKKLPLHETILHQLCRLPLQKWQCLPIPHDNKAIHVYFSDPNNIHYIEQLKTYFQLSLKPVVCPYSQLQKALIHILAQCCYYRAQQSLQGDQAITLAQQLLNDAISKQASDIHIEAKKDHCLLRFRIDGLLHTISEINITSLPPLIARLKVMAACDISEQRKPQDGRFSFMARDQKAYDCRVSTCPILHGEKMVVRIGQTQQSTMTLEQLGCSPTQLTQLKQTKKMNQGLILVTGPTGSGKTNTLYALLNWIKDQNKNICTIENPVEIELPHLNQSYVQPAIGMDFHDLLRTLLRQDPDVIMIGEIRDRNTAMTAIKAAQTGHLVLSTLHTNSCIETLLRLEQMDISLRIINNVIRLIIAQRLIRKLCPYCQHKTAEGCDHCHKGYYGRQGIFEIFTPDETFNQAVSNGHTDLISLQHQAKKSGLISLQEMADHYINSNITDQDEIDRVVA